MLISTQRIQSGVELKNYKQNFLCNFFIKNVKENIKVSFSIHTYEIVVFSSTVFFCVCLTFPSYYTESRLGQAKKIRVGTFISNTTSMIKITSKGNNLNFMAYMPDGSIRECLKVCGRFYLAEINKHFKLTVDRDPLKKEQFILVH